jgi:tartrate dehydrogenase/decarboxylase/D-malate dehydrogenase
MMPEDGLRQFEGFDATLFGAVGAPDIPDHITLWDLRLSICQNSEGEYAGVGGRAHRGLPIEVGVWT